jgi:hypothetical protein
MKKQEPCMAGMNLRSHSLDKLRQIVTTAAHGALLATRGAAGRGTAYSCNREVFTLSSAI